MRYVSALAVAVALLMLSACSPPPVSGPSKPLTPTLLPTPGPAPAPPPVVPPPVPAPPPPSGPTPLPTPVVDPILQAMLSAHNAARLTAGLGPLTTNVRLQAMAQAHADAMAAAGIMSHDSAGDGSFSTRARQSGYRFSAVGENIAEGYPTPDAVVTAWLSDAPHRANVLGAYHDVGLAVAHTFAGAAYWCADYGTAAAFGAAPGALPLTPLLPPGLKFVPLRPPMK